MYVCMYVCTYVPTYVRIYACLHRRVSVDVMLGKSVEQTNADIAHMVLASKLAASVQLKACVAILLMTMIILLIIRRGLLLLLIMEGRTMKLPLTAS